MNIFKYLFYSLALVISVILIIFGINVFPVPGSDAIVFIPPALLYSKGHGLANPLYYITEFTDPTHTNRYNYYVPFYSYLLGVLSQIKPGIKTIFFFCSLLSAANLLLYTRVITAFVTQKSNTWLKALSLLSVAYLATYFLPTVGRPELLTSLLVFLIYILYRKRMSYSPAAFNIFICILFSLVLATQLSCFYFSFLFFITYELFDTKNIYRTITVNIIRFIAILAGFCIVLAISPNGLMNTLVGLKVHIAAVAGRNDRAIPLFIHYWLLAPLNFGFVLIFILAVGCYINELRARLKNIALLNGAFIFVVQALILFGFIKFILYAAPTVYNATQFILPVSAYLFISLSSFAKTKQNTFFIPVLLITYVAGSILFLRSIVLFIAYKSEGKDYDHAKPIANRIAKSYPHVYTTNSLWPLFDNLDSLKIFYGHNMKQGDIIFVQQVNHSFPPMLVKKCTIIYDWNAAGNDRFLGIKLANRPQGFGFVVCKVN